jgi:hypothetical protein
MALNTPASQRTPRSQLFESFRGRLRLGTAGSVPKDEVSSNMPQQQPNSPALDRASTSPTAVSVSILTVWLFARPTA